MFGIEEDLLNEIRELKEALETAKSQLILIADDPRDNPYGDKIQAEVLNIIDKALGMSETQALTIQLFYIRLPVSIHFNTGSFYYAPNYFYLFLHISVEYCSCL